MSQPRDTRHGLLVVVIVSIFAGAAGCRTGAAAGTTVTPAAGGDGPNVGPDPEGREESDNLGDLEARLDRLRKQHQQVSSSPDTGFAVCEDLCDLASNICVVKEKLCDLADRHPGDDSYQALCREARHECREANESCIACAEGSAGQSKPTTPPDESTPPE